MAAYEVTSVTEDQIPASDGSFNQVDVFDVSFTIPGKPGTFTVQVEFGGDSVKNVYDAITAKVNEVNAIYAGSSGASGS